jgi:hypothetical protein
VRNVLVVLFWLWVLVALGIYAYRIFRRITQGPKSERAARADGTTAEGSSAEPRRGGLLSGLAGPPPPPLPDGPVEARLPKALQDLPPPVAATDDAHGDEITAVDTGAVPAPVPTGADHVEPAPIPRPPTLAEALQGIRMPDDLLPAVDPTDAAITDGRRARFTGTGTSVPAVAAELGEELKRLGYAVDGLDTVTSTRAGLSAHRDGTTVTAGVGLDDDTGAVVVQLGI